MGRFENEAKKNVEEVEGGEKVGGCFHDGGMDRWKKKEKQMVMVGGGGFLEG